MAIIHLFFKPLFLCACAFIFIHNSAIAASPQGETASASLMTESTPLIGEFVKRRYTISGSWSIDTIDGEKLLTFSEDFRTKSGPDLKLFLIDQTLEQLKQKDILPKGIRLGLLKSHRGAQTYVIPANIDLSQYESIVIHCEAFDVLWGGFDIHSSSQAQP